MDDILNVVAWMTVFFESVDVRSCKNKSYYEQFGSTPVITIVCFAIVKLHEYLMFYLSRTPTIQCGIEMYELKKTADRTIEPWVVL